MKYTLDTNIFIEGFRSEEAQAEVFAFLNRALPFTYLSAVVMQELAAGARSAEAARDVQRACVNRLNVAGACLLHPARFSPRAAVFSRRSLQAKGGSCSTTSRRSLMTH